MVPLGNRTHMVRDASRLEPVCMKLNWQLAGSVFTCSTPQFPAMLIPTGLVAVGVRVGLGVRTAVAVVVGL
jgi:hypothetical protein